MTTLNDENLLILLSQGESDSVEFKEIFSPSVADAIRQAICAFANDLADRRQPGVIFVGVRNDGSVVGLPVTDELCRQLADMKTDGNIVPPPSMTVEKRIIRGQEVATIIVQPSDSPPVRCRGRIQIRIGPRRGVATAQDERILSEKRRYRDIPFDIHPVPSATIRDLDLLRFEYEYLPQAFAIDVLENNSRSLEEKLAATKMVASADDTTPTVLGLLVIGKNPQDFLPGAYVQFLRLDGTEVTDLIIDSEIIGGSISDVINRLDDKLKAHNRVSIDILSGPLEKRTSLYPFTAIQQITRNAIMHRTYETTNAPVHVYWFNNRIEVTNPGGLYGAATADSFGQPGVVDYRNPNLADAMRTLKFVQRFGFGIPLARRLLREAGHPAPNFDVVGNFVVVEIMPVPIQ